MGMMETVIEIPTEHEQNVFRISSMFMRKKLKDLYMSHL